MSTILDSENVCKPMEVLLNAWKRNPLILHNPNLAFVKSFIEHFGGTVPEFTSDSSTDTVPEENCKSEKSKTKTDTDSKTETNNVSNDKPQDSAPEPEVDSKAKAKADPEIDSEESDLELDTTGVIEPDTDDPQELENLNVPLTPEELEECQSGQFGNDYQKAIRHYTATIMSNPESSLPYAKRAQYYLLMNKPNACIRDCNRCLELNPDSAAAHKFRGRAKRLLGQWEEAAQDLRLACRLDFDEQADEWLREVTPNARKIEEHKRKRERKMQEKLAGSREEKQKKDKEDKSAPKENTQPSNSSFGVDEFVKLMNGDDLSNALKDPEIREAFLDILETPSSIMKYRGNRKVMEFIDTSASKLADFFPGEMAGMPGFSSATGSNAKQETEDGLD